MFDFIGVLKNVHHKFNLTYENSNPVVEDEEDDDESVYDDNGDEIILTLSPKPVQMTLALKKRQYEEEQYSHYGIDKEFKGEIL